MKHFFWLLLLTGLLSCNTKKEKHEIPVIAFLDAFEDATIAQAKEGFFAALKENGYSESNNTIKVIYRNAQGDIPTLTQACDYFISEQVDLIATNTTLSTITAVQKTKDVPVFMMVSPSPELAKLSDASGKAPENLFGTFETLEYIDTSFAMIREVFPSAKKIGAIYNQSEPQSLLALEHLQNKAKQLNLELLALPANNSSETQLVVQSLLSKNIDAFFALPDNTVFASFETIYKSCDALNVPVFTSEAGLVKRGALAAFGADMFQWGYQAGHQASLFLKNNSPKGLAPELVKIRKRVYNTAVASRFKVRFQNNYTAIQ